MMLFSNNAKRPSNQNDQQTTEERGGVAFEDCVLGNSQPVLRLYWHLEGRAKIVTSQGDSSTPHRHRGSK